MSKSASKPVNKEDRFDGLDPFFVVLSNSLNDTAAAAKAGKKKNDDIEGTLVMDQSHGGGIVVFGNYDQRVITCALFDITTVPAIIKPEDIPTALQYDTWFKKHLYYPGEPADFLTTFGISIENARKSRLVIWDPAQERINKMVLGFDEDILDTFKFDDLNMRSVGKTPDMALEKLKQVYGSKSERVEGLLIMCYLQGIYAPVGHFSKGKFNDKNMKKFFALTTLSALQKAAVSRVFLQLEIGAKDGFSLNHYIKAIRSNSITMESKFEKNIGLLDYLFFARTASIGYWAKYSIHYKNTIRDISKGANVKMKNKSKADLKYDMYGPHNIQVGNTQDDSWMSEFDSDNAKTIYYFLCVREGTVKYKKGKVILAEHMMEQIKYLLAANYKQDPKKSANENALFEDNHNQRRKDILKKFIRVIKVDDLYKEMPKDPNMKINVPLSSGFFTKEERLSLRTIGARLTDDEIGERKKRKAKHKKAAEPESSEESGEEEEEEDEEEEDYTSSDERGRE